MSEELKRLWRILENDYNIHTQEDLKKFIKANKLDIGIFTSPIKEKEEYI